MCPKLRDHATTYERLFDRLAHKSDGDELLDAIAARDGATRLRELYERAEHEDVQHAELVEVAADADKLIQHYQDKYCQ